MRLAEVLIGLLIVVATCYILFVGLLYLFQHRMVYYPVKNLSITPAVAGLPFEEAEFKTADSLRLSGWFIPSRQPRATVLFHHGNAENIAGRIETIKILNRLNLNVFIFDYRGYGKSEGKPSEEGTYRDSFAAWQYLTEERSIPGDQILIMGRSLGGAIAAWLGTRVQPAAVVLESVFTSAPALASELYPLIPVKWLIRYNYPTLEYLKDIAAPVFIAHSSDDELIPFAHGRKIFEAAREPKTFFEMQGPHGGAHIQTGEEYVQALDKFISVNSKQ